MVPPDCKITLSVKTATEDFLPSTFPFWRDNQSSLQNKSYFWSSLKNGDYRNFWEQKLRSIRSRKIISVSALFDENINNGKASLIERALIYYLHALYTKCLIIDM